MKINRLTITITLSASIHLAVATYYIGWHSQENLLMSSETVGQPLNIALQQATKPETKQSKAKQISKKKINKQPLRPNKKTTAKSEETEKLIEQQTSETITEKQNTEQNSQYALQSNNMIKYLSSEFRLRFKYPMLARKRGWQGTVVVGLNVTQKGKITQVAIQQSSGHGVLDRNAVNTFRSINQLTPEISQNLLRNHQLSIPVIYNLTGG